MGKAGSALSRIGAVNDAGDDEILRDMFGRIRAARGRLLHIHQVVARSPHLLRAQAAYASALRTESTLPRSLQELMILRIAQINSSAYEQSVHKPIALACGVDAGRIAALPDWRESGLFAPNEKAALAFVDQAAASGEVDEATFSAARSFFSDRQMVEIAALVAWYVGNARFVRALRISSETESPD